MNLLRSPPPFKVKNKTDFEQVPPCCIPGQGNRESILSWANVVRCGSREQPQNKCATVLIWKAREGPGVLLSTWLLSLWDQQIVKCPADCGGEKISLHYNLVFKAKLTGPGATASGITLANEPGDS